MRTSTGIRVAIYGCGNFAKKNRIPNLLQLDSVNIIAACDSNPIAAQETAEHFDIPSIYHSKNGGAYEMLDVDTEFRFFRHNAK